MEVKVYTMTKIFAAIIRIAKFPNYKPFTDLTKLSLNNLVVGECILQFSSE